MAGIPQVITEDRASGAQFIDGSLTINGSNQYLTRTHTASNTKTWTFSCWVKKQRNAAYHQLFTGFETGTNQSGIIFMNDDTLQIYSQGGLTMTLKTSAVYRDSGWMNVVVAIDTIQSTTADRVKLWVNGTRVTDFGTATYPSQNDETYVNTNITHYVGSNQPSSNTFYGQYAQAYFIDGQQLGPENFGFTDPLTGTWRPKKFDIGAEVSKNPNNGTTWSSTTDSGLTFANGVTGIFDGSLSTRGGAPTTNNNYATLTNNVSISCTNGIRIYWNGVGSGQRYIRINGTTELDDGSAQLTPGWSPLSSFSGTINKIEVKSASSGSWSLAAIEVDGFILIDGAANNSFYLPMDGNSPIGEDKSGIVTPNNGSIWSNSLTSSSGFRGSEPKTNAFDGNTSSICSAVGSGTVTFTSPVTFASNSTIRVFLHGGNHTVTVNGGSNQTISAGSFQTVTYSNSGNATFTMTFHRGGGADTGVRAIEINGVILTDGQIGNNWTPGRFGGSVTLNNPTVSGAIPIHNTNDAGTVAKRGVRTDSKTYTVTASGGNYYIDGALKPTLNAYRGGSYTFDYTGATSHPFYLSSLPDGKHNSKAYSVEFDGSGDYLSATGTGTLAASSNWCMECFFYCTGNSGGTYRIMSANEASQSTEYILMRIRLGQYQFSTDSANSGTIESAHFNQWTHMALTKSGTTVRGFINGKKIWEKTDNNTVTITNLITGWGYGGEYFPGFISNARFVNGSSVYTADFTPPTTSLTNITNTHLLCCQDNNAATGVIASGSITVAGDAAASQTKQPFLYDNNHGNFGVNTATSNTTKITIPHTAADTLYYYCNAHSGMGSSINVTTDIFKADPYAWKCFLACPYAGNEFDVSDQINCNSTASAATNWNSVQGRNGATFYSNARYFAAGGSKNINYAGKQEFNFTGAYKAFTIEFFATPSSGSSDGAPIASKGYYSNYGNWYLRLSTTNGGRINFYSYDGQSNGQNNEFQNLGCTDPNRVHHVVVQRDESNLMTFILDGVIVGQASNVTRALDDGLQSGLTVGRIPSNNTTNSAHNWYLGYITDLRIYSGLAKYSGSVGDHVFTPPSVTPDVLPDTPSGVSGKSKLTKIAEGAVTFDGSGDYLDAPSSSDFGLASNDNFTVECFVFTGVGNQELIRQGTNNAASDGMYFSITSSGALETRISGTTKTTSGKIAFNSWNHISVCRSGGTLYMSINGVVESHGSVTNASTTGAFKIGSNFEESSFFTGHISNVRFVKGTGLYTSNFTPPTEPLTEVTNTKLLCCQSNTEPGVAAVSPSLGGVNDGTVWSSGISNAASSFPGTNLFDGSTSTYVEGDTNGTDVTFSGNISGTTIEIYGNKQGSSTLTINGVDKTSLVPSSPGYFTITGVTEITSMVFNRGASGNYVDLYAIRVDGVVLVDPVLAKGNASATNFNPFTDDINAIRGQETGYATLNHLILSGGATLSNGNLDILGSTPYRTTPSTIGIKSGKYYWEYYLTYFDGGSTDCHLGICLDNFMDFRDTWVLSTNDGWGYTCQGGLGYHGNSQSNLGSSARTTGDIIAFSFDADAGKLYIYVNGVIINSGNPAFTGLTNGPYYPFVSTGSSASHVSCNFGQKSFKFPPPDGFQPLNLSNVQPEKVIARSDQYVGVSLWNGNGTSQNITGLKHKPDFVWIKKRTGGSARSHQLFDSVRGVYKTLHSDSPNAQDNNTNRLTAFNQDGFAVGGDDGANGSGGTFVGWTWKAGGSKGTFNVDDVGYANASDVNMNAGGLNSSVYNQSQNWTNLITFNAGSWNGNGTAPFDNDSSNSDYGDTTRANGGYATLDISSLTGSRVISVTSEQTEVTITHDGGTTTFTPPNTSRLTHTFAAVNNPTSIKFNGLNSNSVFVLVGVSVDGKRLINSNITPTNIPSIAATGSSVGTKQGFSIVSYTGTGGSTASIPHGLEQSPEFVIIKNLDGGSQGSAGGWWAVFHSHIPQTAKQLYSFNTSAATDSTWNNHGYISSTTSSVVNVNIGDHSNDNLWWTHNNGTDYIMYAWHSVPGLQKFGEYDGSGSDNGTFIDCGFRPAILWIKSWNTNGQEWVAYDSKRTPSNTVNKYLYLDQNVVDQTGRLVDFVSNGFKFRQGGSGATDHGSSRRYIYMAWAEAPTVNLYGGHANAR